jgi:hypothetical protein
MRNMMLERSGPPGPQILGRIAKQQPVWRWRSPSSTTRDEPTSVGRKLTRMLRWVSGAGAVALAVAGCGGGGGSADVAPNGAASAQLNPVVAFALAQQSVIAPAAAAAPAPASGNMVPNAGFESGTSGWIDWGNVSVVSGQANSGTLALRVGAGAGGAGQEVAGVVPGNTYRLSAQAKVSAASETVYIGVNFIDASGAPFTQNSVLVNSTTYTSASLDVVAPPNAVRALVYVWKNAGSGVASVDDFFLHDTGRHGTATISSGNLVVNGGFDRRDRELADWVDWGNAIEVSETGPGFDVVQVGRGAGGIGQDIGGIVAGGSYRVSAVARVNAPGDVGYLGVMFMDDAGTGLRAQNVVFRSTGGYTRVQADVTAPAGATKAQVFVWKNAGPAFAYLDDVALVQLTPGSPSSPSDSHTVLANATTTARGVAVLKAGTRIAAWSDDTGVHGQLFDAQGALLGSAVSIAPSGTFSGVAALAGGGYVVEYDQPGMVLAQVVGASGTPVGAPTVVRTQAQVTAEPPEFAVENRRLLGGAGVYALGDGGFVAEYRQGQDVRIPGNTAQDLFGQHYDALGNAVGDRTYIAAESPVNGFSATSASTPSGGLVTAATLICPCGGSGLASISVRDSALNLQPGSSSPPGEQTSFQSAAGLTNGNYIAVWTVPFFPPSAGAGKVRGKVFGPNGANVTPVLTFPNAGARARVTALAGGGFVLSWGTSAQVFDALGQAVGGVMEILDGSIAATLDGGFVVVAQVGTQLVEQQYAVGG